MRLLQKLKRKEGQTAVKFVIVCLVVFFFLLFFLSLAFVLILSQYMDYATFMAARTYKSAHGDRASQEAKAFNVFREYVTPVENSAMIKNIRGPIFLNPGGREHRSEGVRVEYDVNLFYLPPLFAKNRLDSVITLTSESYLGRDPNYDECFNFFRSFTNRLGISMRNGSADLTGQMEDNGC